MDPNNVDVSRKRNQKYLERISESNWREVEDDEDTGERQIREEESERSSSDEDILSYNWTRYAALKKVKKKFRDVQLDSESSDTTDNSDVEEADSGKLEEELCQNCPGNNRFSMILGQNVERRLVYKIYFPTQ